MLWPVAERSHNVPSASQDPVISSPDAYAAAQQALTDLLMATARFSIPPYDYWEPLVIGGLTGKYILYPVPFDTTCEYRILCLTASDVTYCSVTKEQGFGAPTNGQNIGGAPGANSQGRAGVVLAATLASTAPGPNEWLPADAQTQLIIDLNVASSHAAWVTLLFRRRRTALGVYLEGA